MIDRSNACTAAPEAGAFLPLRAKAAPEFAPKRTPMMSAHKDGLQAPQRVMAHLSIVLSLAFATFLVLDYFNPLMAFSSNEASTLLLALLCASSLATSALLLRALRLGASAKAGR